MRIALTYLTTNLEKLDFINEVYSYLTYFKKLELSTIELPLTKRISDSYDLALSIGGDGTFLATVHALDGYAKAFVGLTISEESTGAYCIQHNNWQQGLEKIVRGDYQSFDAMRISAYSEKKDYGKALNEISLMPKRHGSIFKYELELRTEKFDNGRSTAIIFSTPTGSTAYNLSAGGPVVDKRAKVIIVTPESPNKPQVSNLRISYFPKDLHNLISPYIMSAEAHIAITVKEDSMLSMDGSRRNEEIPATTKLLIKGAPPVKIIEVK